MNTPELQSELNETLRKIGRNVLHFQRMEAMLKLLISHSSIQGTAKDLKANHEKAVDAVSRQTMGNLVKNFFTSVYTERNCEEVTTSKVEDDKFSFYFKIEGDQACVEQQRAALDQLVQERNVLIHQMLSRLDQTSLESCRELGVLLDEQAERMRPEYENLRSLVMALQTTKKEAFEALAKNICNSKMTTHD